MPNILVVDDELSIRESFSLILEGQYTVLLAASGEAGLKIVSEQKVDMVYLDIRMPGLDGLATLKKIKQLDPDLEVIMVTAVNEMQKASEAVRTGAQDYVVKPFDVDHILKLTAQVLRKKSILKQGTSAQKKSNLPKLKLVSQNEKMLELAKLLDKIKSSQRVLLQGEAGTEKDLLAHLIHNKSEQALLPFQQIDLSLALPAAEIKNLLSQQDKGTLYLNNLEALPNDLVAIVRGSGRRLIGSTSVALDKKNKDLFDLFSEIHLELPALRLRPSDVPLLLNHFIDHFANKHGRRISLSAATLNILTSYTWPGNTEQLSSLIERLTLTSKALEVAATELPIDILLETGSQAGKKLLDDFEKNYITTIYEQSGRNKEKTAERLGIKPHLLAAKI